MLTLHPALVIGAFASLAVGVVAVAAASERDKLQSLNVRETVLTAEQGRNLNRLARLLTVLEQFRRDPPPALLVSPDDAVSAVRAAILVKAITPELQRRARLYAAEAGEIARQRRLAAVASEALFTADSQLAEARLIQPPSQRDQNPLQDENGEVSPPRALMAPADGAITQRFGQAVPGGGKANGLTIQTASGAKVAAPDGGLVQYVGPVKGWGVILILRLAGGYHLVLAGLDRANVSVGQSVAAGAPVGWMADGRQSPPELYLEIRERGAPVDPGRWMKDGSGLRPTVG
ncbi:murein hydrolase activator EnvC [Phenylobacterium sp.]|uniref:murein hydrolase activator EnvC family protein n=1 Tax=Phenylobacterium sp. TaxID=1871053 RepID=UPI002720D6A1|nr:peptidoglycan DD-metalloendopeptidase family protein [Phenylobacterium sp.]MDO8799341.1 peptidoglycan DD-metalloendopeptidase family protein [Phenylobacterium sp.]